MNFVTFLRQFLFMLSIFGRGSSLMRGSVIKRMYAGFALIIILFAVTIAIMMGGMHDIHGKFETVSKSSLPLVSLSNQTSVELLSADKSFKDFLTTENKQRMEEMRQEFA
ncbi:methyl-accepting chemotaxis protein, partial [Vibrio sp. Y184]|nr:methyl-accepting chemotaxis protein [Vibrio sp. Y184]